MVQVQNCRRVCWLPKAELLWSWEANYKPHAKVQVREQAIINQWCGRAVGSWVLLGGSLHGVWGLQKELLLCDPVSYRRHIAACWMSPPGATLTPLQGLPRESGKWRDVWGSGFLVEKVVWPEVVVHSDSVPGQEIARNLILLQCPSSVLYWENLTSVSL